MRIPVVLKDGTEVRVIPPVLDRMLDEQQVSSFRRAGRWVAVGRDPVRGTGSGIYRGRERRSKFRRRAPKVD